MKMERVHIVFLLVPMLCTGHVRAESQRQEEASGINHGINFTKHWIKSVNGQDVDIEYLALQNALICPIENRCSPDGPDGYSHGNFTDRANITVEKCPKCDCNPVCRQNNSCCTDSPYGYLDYECINVALFPENSGASFYMIARCPEEDGVEQELIAQCRENDISPVSSKDTGLVYRNRACAQCNDDVNTVHWKIIVQCQNSTETVDVNQFTSIAELQRMMVENNCMIAFTLSQPTQAYMVPAACTPYSGVVWNIVERCNVTGLWKNYNQAIDWACRSLQSKFMFFKNVFCYICNPGTSSVSPSEGTIYSCNTTGKWEHYNSLIEHLCLTLPAIERLAPFKNVYCMMCNGINVYDLFNQTSIAKTSISEFVFYYRGDSTITSDVDINIELTGDNLINAMKEFMDSTYSPTLSRHRPNIRGRPKPVIPDSVTLSFLNELKTVCGGRNVCEESLSMLGLSLNDTLGSNELCGNCTCALSCGEDGNCCQDILFRKRPYLCLENDHILTIPEDAEHAIADSIYPLHSLYSYSLVVDTCLSSDIGHTSDFCTGENGTVDELSYIPVTPKPDTMGKIKTTYKNIHCLLCNVKHHKTAIITLKLLCNNFLEFPLFTDISELLRHTKTYCRTSFVASLNSPECNYHGIVHDEIDEYFYERPPISIRNKDLSPGLHSLLEHLYGNGTDKVETHFTSCNQSGNWGGKETILQDVCEQDGTDQSLLSLPRYRINKIKYMNFACFACNPDADETDVLPDGPISQCNLTGGWGRWDNVTEELCLDSEQVSYWLPFKNMHCSKCNLGRPKLVSSFENPDPNPDPGDEGGGGGSETPGTNSGNDLVYRTLFSLSSDDWLLYQKRRAEETCVSGTYDYVLMTCRQLYCSQGYRLYGRVCRPTSWYAKKTVVRSTLYLTKHPDCYHFSYSHALSMCPFTETSNVILNFTDIFNVIRSKIQSGLVNTTLAFFDSFYGHVDSSCVDVDNFLVHTVTNIEIQLNIYVHTTNNITQLLSTIIDAQTGKYIVNSTSGTPVELFAADTKRYKTSLLGQECIVTVPEYEENEPVDGDTQFYPEYGAYGDANANTTVVPEYDAYGDLDANTTVVPEYDAHGDVDANATVVPEYGTYWDVDANATVVPEYDTYGGANTDTYFPDYNYYGQAGDTYYGTGYGSGVIIANKFLLCPQVQLSESEFHKSNISGDIVLTRVNVSFEIGEYLLINDTFLRICADTYDERLSAFGLGKPKSSRMKYHYFVFSLICSSLSLFCLFLTFLVYCILHQLRTVPGQNNMVLCFCLFFAQLILQFGLNEVDNSYLCISMGILIHFFWLATFCAMNVCSYHMFKVFCFKQLQSTVSVSRVRYLGYIFGVPFLIISLTVLVHLLLTDMAYCGYGKYFCFLSDVYSTTVAFFCPAILIFLFNITFFVVTLYKIRTRPSVQSSVHRNDLFIYIKLSTLIGVAWPLQFVDAMFELSVFSFFVVAINALQGVFIFLSYICNAKVVSLLTTKVRTASSSNSSSTCTRTHSNDKTGVSYTTSVRFKMKGTDQGNINTSTRL